MHGNHKLDLRGRIKAERERLGLSIHDAALVLEMSRQSYRQLERKTADPRISTIRRLVEHGWRFDELAPEIARLITRPAVPPVDPRTG
jgi:transcriptional regulator with XRE-family HTH domain